ncbi:hypothetical protein Tco_1473946 [Tanacetum coccineum]
MIFRYPSIILFFVWPFPISLASNHSHSASTFLIAVEVPTFMSDVLQPYTFLRSFVTTVGGGRIDARERNEEGPSREPNFPPPLPVLASFPTPNLRPFMGLSLPRSGRLGCRVP